MKFLTSVCICLLLITGSLAATTAQTPASFVCETTAVIADRPAANVDPFGRAESVFYEDGIWVSIPNDGVLELAPDREISFGIYQGWRTETVTWLRDKGVEGFVVVSGQRLDEKLDLQPRTPLSPERQYTRVGYVHTGIAFPSEGCWEVTGSVGAHEITWVVDVRFVEVATTPVSLPGDFAAISLQITESGRRRALHERVVGPTAKAMIRTETERASQQCWLARSPLFPRW